MLKWLVVIAAAGVLAIASLPMVMAVAFTGADACQVAPTSDAAPAGSLDTFLAAIRRHESGNNYTAKNPNSTASGAYQFLTTTWDSEARAAGETQDDTGPAYLAPPAVQDTVAAFMATNAYNGPAGHDWLRVADIWYLGHVATPVELDVVPRGGNTITPRQYEAQIATLMSGNPGTPPEPVAACMPPDGPGGEPAQVQQAIVFALAQLGKPYLWGGTGPDAWDCSGLVQAAYGAAGVKLPRTTYDQVDIGQPVAQADLLPGDLVLPDAGHIQIYLGNNMVVEAPHTGAFVQVVRMWGFWQARRPIPWTTAVTTDPVLAPLSTAQMISDMGPNTVHPAALPPGYSFYAHAELDNPTPPVGMNATTSWGTVWTEQGGSSATNTRVEVANEQLWLWFKSQARWVEAQVSAAPNGGDYLNPSSGPFDNGSEPADTRTEPDGGTGVKIIPSAWFHFWPTQGRVQINQSDIGGAFTTFSARLVLDQANGPDDRAQAHYVAAAGADWWSTVDSPWPDNAQVFYSRFKAIGVEWQTFTGNSWSPAAIEGHPPPVG